MELCCEGSGELQGPAHGAGADVGGWRGAGGELSHKRSARRGALLVSNIKCKCFTQMSRRRPSSAATGPVAARS